MKNSINKTKKYEKNTFPFLNCLDFMKNKARKNMFYPVGVTSTVAKFLHIFFKNILTAPSYKHGLESYITPLRTYKLEREI